MPRSKPKFRLGITKIDTSLQSEGGYIDGNRVRGNQGQIEPIGGWQIYTPETYDGAARGAHAWTNLQGQSCIAFGTHSRLYGMVNGALRDITPFLHLTVLNNAFSTVSGSNLVTVDLAWHGLKVGDPVIFSNHQTTVGGLTVEGTYTVTSVPNVNQFRITHASNASSTVTAGGGFVDISAALPVGLISTDPSGYGTGTYGTGSYGSAGTDSAVLRVWSLDNFGENLLANPSGYGICEWQPESNYEELAFNGTFTGNANGWALGTGWTYASNAITATAGTASNLSQNVKGIMEGGRTYIVSFTVTRSAGTLKFRVNAGDPAAVIDVGEASSTISKSGTYTRLFRAPANPSDIVFEKDNAFAGAIDNVSLKLYERAAFIRTAPARIDAMFVDPRGVVVALGCVQIDGIYNATCVRNSAVGNNRLWIPDTNNVASELILRGGGGRLMAGAATRQQSMVWGDDGVFSLQWQGQPGQAFTPQLLATSCGLLSRHSFCKANGFVLFVTNTRDFFIFRGIGATSLGIPEKIDCPVRDYVFDTFDFNQTLKAHAGLNPAYTEAWFFYPDTRDGNECSRYVTFNWISGEWYIGQIARSAWVPSGILPNPLGFEPRSGLTGLIHEHEVGRTANGGALGAWIESAMLDAEDGERLVAVMGLALDVKSQVGNMQVTIKSRLDPQGTAEKITGPFLCAPNDRKKDFRLHTRQFAARWDWVTTGGFGRLGSWSLDIRPTSARR